MWVDNLRVMSQDGALPDGEPLHDAELRKRVPEVVKKLVQATQMRRQNLLQRA